MECQKVKCKADCRIKIGQSQLNMQAILKYFLSLLRSYRLKVIDYIREKKCKCVHEKSDSKDCKTNIECRKVNDQTTVKIEQI